MVLKVGDYVRLDGLVDVRVPKGVKGVVVAEGSDGHYLIRVPYDRMLFEAHESELKLIRNTDKEESDG